MCDHHRRREISRVRSCADPGAYFIFEFIAEINVSLLDIIGVPGYIIILQGSNSGYRCGCDAMRCRLRIRVPKYV